MRVVDIILKKRYGGTLTKEEIHEVIDGYVKGIVPDYQVSALLMAITINGMTDEETINLTNAMLNSGDKLDLSDINGIIVDKHSTGGVGDKVTLVLGPILASLGVKMAKMSGRGLGHTGGTIDKLESIPSFNTNLTNREFINQVNKINIAIVSQTGDLDPADKKLYALRDVTGTVESIPLIASSIMSKKLASGADVIVIDVKVGNGALMKNIDDARKLANIMCKIGKSNGKTVICLLTNMSEPLGFAVGNSLEVIESINTLKGNGPSDLLELVMTIASMIISALNKMSLDEARSMIFNSINSGKAYNKFKELVMYQNGDINGIKVSSKYFSIKSNKAGYINHINAYKLGEIARLIGAGRLNKEDKIDYEVGLLLNKKVGDYVEVNEELLKIFVHEKDFNINDVLGCYEIDKELRDIPPLIYEIIN